MAIKNMDRIGSTQYRPATHPFQQPSSRLGKGDVLGQTLKERPEAELAWGGLFQIRRQKSRPNTSCPHRNQDRIIS